MTKEISPCKLMTQEQKKFKGIKRMNERERQRQPAFQHSKLLEYGLTQNGVENVCYIHLRHHPINMDIHSNSNIINHYLETTPKFKQHIKLMWQQRRKEHVAKL
jgi:hypothetical protein